MFLLSLTIGPEEGTATGAVGLRSELGGDDGLGVEGLPSVGAGDAIEPFAAITSQHMLFE